MLMNMLAIPSPIELCRMSTICLLPTPRTTVSHYAHNTATCPVEWNTVYSAVGLLL
jgi:hypothetical protein